MYRRAEAAFAAFLVFILAFAFLDWALMAWQGIALIPAP